MKKVLSGMIAAVMTICMSVSVFASPNSSVSIKNNDSKSTPVTYEYAPNQLGETCLLYTSLYCVSYTNLRGSLSIFFES